VTLGAVILAAGSGVRLGGVAKALLPIAEQTYLARIVATARAAGLAEAVVVVGVPHGDAVAAHARSLGLRVVVNPEPSRGMGSSVAHGFAAIGEGKTDAAWLWPVDIPLVTVDTLRTLQASLGGHAVAQPLHGGRGGHPPLIARSVWASLAVCTNARDVIAASDVVRVPVPDPAVLRDVDTPADVEALS
jgi:molybdenum cofactor cytidylyltransferase